MRRLFLLLSLITSMNVCMQAQTNVDSLENVLETQELTPREQFGIYSDICYFFVYNNPDKTLLYAEKAIILSQKEKNELWVSICYEYIGRAYEVKGEYNNAAEYYRKALDIAIKEKIEHQEAFVYVSLASLYGRLGKSITSIDYLLKALLIYEKRDNERDKMQQALILSNIAEVHRGQEDNERAIYYLKRALEIAEDLDYTQAKMKIYNSLGDINRIEKSYDEALEYLEKAIELSALYNDKIMESVGLGSLALTYSEGYQDHINAEKKAKECLRVAEELNDPYVLIAAWRILSDVFIAQKRYKEGESAALKAWRIDTTSLDQASNIIKNIALANVYLEDKEKASYYFDKYIETTKKKFNINSQNLISDMQVKYETEKKEIRIATLEKEQQLYLWLGIASGVVVLLVLGVLFYRHRLNKQQVKQLEQEKQLIATQSVLDGETAERSRLARDLHDGLGGMLSVVKLNLKEMKTYSIVDAPDVDRFNQALGMLDQSIGELRRVAHHMMPESLMRYGLKVSLEDYCRAIPNARFQYYGSEERLDDRLEVVLYRCAYELVNNAVKYAEAMAINMQLIIDDGLVSLTVHDDGVGFDPEQVTAGSGLDNIRTRVSAYNGKMTIHSSPGNGTEVSIEIEKGD